MPFLQNTRLPLLILSEADFFRPFLELLAVVTGSPGRLKALEATEDVAEGGGGATAVTAETGGNPSSVSAKFDCKFSSQLATVELPVPAAAP